MPAVSFASLLPLGDTTIRHELLFFWVFLRFERKVADLNLTDLHPKLRTVNYPNYSMFMSWGYHNP